MENELIDFMLNKSLKRRKYLIDISFKYAWNTGEGCNGIHVWDMLPKDILILLIKKYLRNNFKTLCLINKKTIKLVWKYYPIRRFWMSKFIHETMIGIKYSGYGSDYVRATPYFCSIYGYETFTDMMNDLFYNRPKNFQSDFEWEFEKSVKSCNDIKILGEFIPLLKEERTLIKALFRLFEFRNPNRDILLINSLMKKIFKDKDNYFFIEEENVKDGNEKESKEAFTVFEFNEIFYKSYDKKMSEIEKLYLFYNTYQTLSKHLNFPFLKFI